MAQVNYNGYTISDATVKEVLENISAYFGADVSVTSGDRTTVPDGGSTTSLHLSKRAADFYVVGIDYGTAYLNLKNLGYDQVFKYGHSYEFIWHGVHTGTTGQHLHLGRYGASSVSTVKFISEGTTSDETNDYTPDATLPLSQKLF